MKRPETLSPRFVENVTRPGKYGDGYGGHGLALVVKERGNGRTRKNWVQRIRIDGKPTNLGLGTWPYISVSMARQRAFENRAAIERGENPLVRKPTIPTLAEAAECVIELHAPGWKNSGKSAGQWRASLRDYIYPSLGDRTVDSITTGEVLSCLAVHWTTKHETMRRLKQRLSVIFRWTIAEGHRPDDPAGPALSAALPKNGNGKRHHAALPYQDVAGALDTVRQSGAHPSTRLCLELLTLTATRSGEARAATWDEIEGITWTVPSERTKTGKEHRVPLSDAALSVLAEARERTGGRGGLIFPSKTGRALSDNALSKLFRDLGIPGTPHGLRSGFRSWAASTGKPADIAEMALGHAVKGIEGVYQRSDLYDRRRAMMQSWSDYLARKPADVVQLRA